MDLNQFRQQYPQYNDIDDETLVNSLHEKFYSDIPKDEFLEKIRPIEETAGVGEAFVGGTKRFLSTIGTGLAAPFTSGEEASVEGIEREKKITERSATSLENVKQAFKQDGITGAAGEVVSQVPGAIAEQSPILASIYGGFQLVKNVPGPMGAAARIITPMLPIFFSMAGSNMQRKAEEDIAQGKDVDINEVGAYATAFGQTAVERVGLALSGVTRLLGLSALKETGTEAAERLARQSLTEAITKGTAKFAAFEIPTEVSQQMMERYYAGLSLSDDDAMNEYAETAFAVSLMSPIGSFAGYRQRSGAKAIADPVDQDGEVKTNAVKDNEEKDDKELIKDSEEDIKLKEKGDALLNASLDPEKMPVGPTEEEILIEEQRKIMEEQNALTDEQVDKIAAQEGIIGSEVAGFDEAAFRSQLKPNSAEMSAEEQKSYMDTGVLPESYVQRKVDEEKKRVVIPEVVKPEGPEVTKPTVGKKSTFFLPDGTTEEVEVVGISEDSGRILVRDKNNEESMVDYAKYSTTNPLDPSFEIEGFEIKPGVYSFRVDSLTDKQLDSITMRVETKLKAQQANNMPGAATFERQLNALKAERERRTENVQGQTTRPNTSGPGNTGGGSTTPVDGRPKDAKKIVAPVGDAVDNTESTSGGAASTATGLDSTLSKKEQAKRKKLEKQKLKLIEQAAIENEYNIDTPQNVKKRIKIRESEFNSPLDTNEDKQKINQEINSLAKELKTKVPQFLKTGAVVYSPLEESPFDRAKSTDEFIENTIDDYILEESMDTKTPASDEKETTEGKDAKGKNIVVTAQEQRDRRGEIRKEFYDSPILDNYLEKIGETKESRIDKEVKNFRVPVSPIQSAAQKKAQDAEKKQKAQEDAIEVERLIKDEGMLKKDAKAKVKEDRKAQDARDKAEAKRKEAEAKAAAAKLNASAEVINNKDDKFFKNEVNKENQKIKKSSKADLIDLQDDFDYDNLRLKKVNFISNSEAKRILEQSPNAEVGIENINKLLDRMIRVAENPKAPLLDPETNRPFTIEKRNEYERDLKFQKRLLLKLMQSPIMKDIKLNVVSERRMKDIERKRAISRNEDVSKLSKTKVALGEYIETDKGRTIGLKGNNIFVLDKLTSIETIRTFTHEVSHADTVYGIKFINTEQALELTEILDKARRVAREKGVTKFEGDFYGLTNLAELTAESLSNNKFSDFLRETSSVRPGQSSLLDDILNFIRKLLGFDQVIPVSEYSLLDDIMIQNKTLSTFGAMPTDDAQLAIDIKKMKAIQAANLLKEGKSEEIINALINPNERLAREAKDDSKQSDSDSDIQSSEEIEARNKEGYKESKGFLSRAATALYNFYTADNLYDAIGGKETINKVNQRFVDISYPLKVLEEQLRKAKQLIIGEENFNNFYEQATLMNGVSQNHLKALMPIMREFEQSISEFMELYKERNPGKDDGDARAYAQRLLTAQHEAERREVVHMISVPLSIKPTMKYVDKDGKTKKISPAEMRQEIMGIITSSKTKIDKAQLDKFKKRLLELADPANNYVDGVEGKSYGNKNPKKGTPIPTNIADSTYDVTSLNYNTAISFRNELNELKNNDPQFYEALTNIQKDMNRIQRGQIKNELAPEGIKGILELAQISNFAPMQSQNIIDMYGWDYYIPLKGKSKKQGDTDRTIETMYDDSGGALSTKFKKYDATMEGSQKDSEDPFSQVIVDASQAAARAGRIGFTTAIFNSVKNVRKYLDVNGNVIDEKNRRGVIDGKIEKEFTFEERHKNDPEIEEYLKRKDTIVHFKPDGSLVIISIKDPKILAAVRGLPREDSTLLDFGNQVTGLIGQLHTRFNVKFAPLNFVRDAITNLYLVGADLGYKDMVGYSYAIGRQLKGNLIHTGKIVNFYINGDIQAARVYANKLNKKGNPYGLTMLDYLQKGGMVSITAALSNRTALQQQRKEIKAGKAARTQQVIIDYFDTYMGMFELAARVSVFSIYRDNYLAKNSPGRTINNVPKNILNAANETASAYAKNLSNFEKMGEKGRTLGAWFMFFRASMVGASRAMQSIAPALITTEQAVADLDPTIKGNADDLAEFIKDYEIKRRRAQTMAVSLMGIGAVLYGLATLANEAAGDDEGNKTLDDDLSRWTRYARMPLGFVPGFDEDDVLQIPWGFGLGGLPAIGTQIAGLAFSNENSKASIVGNILNITLDSFAPFPVSKMNPTDGFRGFAMWVIDSGMPTIGRPIFEYATNTNAFGSPISNLQTSRRYGSAYQVRGSTPAMFQDLTQAIAEGKFLGIGEPGEYDLDPNVLYFFANNYADGAATIAQNFYSAGLTATGKKEFELKFDTIVLGSFFSKYSDVDQRKFSRTSQEIAKLESKLNLFKGSNPVLYYETLSKYPVAPAIIARYNDHKGELNKITAQINAVKRDSTIDRKTKGAILEPLEYYQKMIKRQMINMVDQEINDGLLD